MKIYLPQVLLVIIKGILNWSSVCFCLLFFFSLTKFTFYIGRDSCWFTSEKKKYIEGNGSWVDITSHFCLLGTQKSEVFFSERSCHCFCPPLGSTAILAYFNTELCPCYGFFFIPKCTPSSLLYQYALSDDLMVGQVQLDFLMASTFTFHDLWQEHSSLCVC